MGILATWYPTKKNPTLGTETVPVFLPAILVRNHQRYLKSSFYVIYKLNSDIALFILMQ